MTETSKNMNEDIESNVLLLPVPSGRLISDGGKHVNIDQEGVERLAQELFYSITDRLQIPDLGKQGLLLSPDDPRLVDWVFVVDTLNFCFWSPKGAPKWSVSGHSGYYGLEAAMKRAIQDGYQITNPEFYSQITKKQLKHLLRSDNGAEIPLMDARVASLREVGQILLKKYNGTFKTCVKEANRSALKLLYIVVQNFPCFNDEATYKGIQVSFYKRAQILAADLWNLFNGRGWGEFYDIDSLSMFADYRVPQVMVYFGVLKYSDELMEKLEHDTLLPNGSLEEVEIRLASIHAVELIKTRIQEKIRAQNLHVKAPNSILIDYFLWCYRRKHAREMERIPYHKTLSIYY